MENASRAFLDAVRASMRQIRAAFGATVINPALLTSAEWLQYEGYLRREETNAAIMAQIKAGVPLRRIAKNTGHSRKLVRAVARGERSDVFRTRESSLEVNLPWLNAQWDSGARNATAIWRKLKDHQGFRGALRVIGEWATRRRRAENARSPAGSTSGAATGRPRPGFEGSRASRRRSRKRGSMTIGVRASLASICRFDESELELSSGDLDARHCAPRTTGIWPDASRERPGRPLAIPRFRRTRKAFACPSPRCPGSPPCRD